MSTPFVDAMLLGQQVAAPLGRRCAIGAPAMAPARRHNVISIENG